TSGGVAGVRYPRTGKDSAGRIVFLSFPLDALPQTGPDPDNRAAFLRKIVSFLIPGLNGRATIALDSPAYNIPSFVTVEVGDADQAGHGTIPVTFFSTTQASGVGATLQETTLPGLFRGTIQIISSNYPPTPGKLRVQSGDQIWVDYFDASSNATVRATAVIDTVKPSVSSVAADPDYESAVITWTTSEPADSLVQFGESAQLGRTASDGALVTSHSAELRGLLPDKTYYFQVVSRDAAGN